MRPIELSANRWLLRLERGEELMQTVRVWMGDADVDAAVLHGIGAALSAELGHYQLAEKRYQAFVVAEPTEVLSLLGNLGRLDDDAPAPHVHATLARHDGSAIGGHVMTLTVGATLELDIEVFPGRLSRRLDEEIGLPLIAALD